MRRKFDVCYTMAKESIPFAKYPALLALEAYHGVNLGPAYSTPDSAKIFTGYIAASQRQAFVNTLSKSLYEKSPKKSRELASIVEDLKGAFEFPWPTDGNLPIQCQGTRWITRKGKLFNVCWIAMELTLCI